MVESSSLIRGKVAGLTKGSTFFQNNALFDGSTGDMANRCQPTEAHHPVSAKIIPENQDRSDLPLCNRFTLLSHPVTCSTNQGEANLSMGPDQAQDLSKLKAQKKDVYLVENRGTMTGYGLRKAHLAWTAQLSSYRF